MPELRNRIASAGTNMSQAMGTYHPAGNGSVPMVMPLSLVTLGMGGVAVQDVTPLYTEDGAIIPATAPGSWGQLRAAGRP
jgi:hypothetical protein